MVYAVSELLVRRRSGLAERGASPKVVPIYIAR